MRSYDAMLIGYLVNLGGFSGHSNVVDVRLHHTANAANKLDVLILDGNSPVRDSNKSKGDKVKHRTAAMAGPSFNTSTN